MPTERASKGFAAAKLLPSPGEAGMRNTGKEATGARTFFSRRTSVVETIRGDRWSVSPWGVLLSILVAGSMMADAAEVHTPNFVIIAADPGLAKQVADAAEKYRRDLAMYWLDEELPPWRTRCPIEVIAGPNLAAQGVTEYQRNPVRDFRMQVVGTPQRILDSVLPHEVTHTILASYFGRPLPRWADEGICTTVEHESEKRKHEAKLREFLTSRRGIAMNRLFLLTEYPQDILPMYAQGYSVCQFLIAQGGPHTFVQFLTDYMQRPSWTENVRRHYGYDSLGQLQDRWLAWVRSGSGDVTAYTARPEASSIPTLASAATTPQNPSALSNPSLPDPASLLAADIRPPQVEPLSPESPAAPAEMVQTPPPDRIASRSSQQRSVANSATPVGRNGGGWYSRQSRPGNANTSDRGTGTAGSMAPPSVQNQSGYGGSYQAATPPTERRLGY